jgi:hypothetical protein
MALRSSLSPTVGPEVHRSAAVSGVMATSAGGVAFIVATGSQYVLSKLLRVNRNKATSGMLDQRAPAA